MWRRNRHPNCAVDLNRNFAWSYRKCFGSTSNCLLDNYNGPEPASELETKALSALFASIRPMSYLSYHSYGEYILWPSGCAQVEEDALFREVGEQLNANLQNDAGLTGQWTIGPISEAIYQAPGSSVDEAYGAYGALAFTIEVNSDGFQPVYADWRDLTVQRQRLAWQTLLRRTLDGPSLRGQVRDSTTGLPLQASYAFTNRPFLSGQLPLSTDPNGYFARAVVGGSEFEVAFSAEGYLPWKQTVRVGGGPVALAVRLDKDPNPPNKPPTVQIVSPKNEAYVSGMVRVEVQVSDPDGLVSRVVWQGDITAIAYDNLDAASPKAAVTVTVFNAFP